MAGSLCCHATPVQYIDPVGSRSAYLYKHQSNRCVESTHYALLTTGYMANNAPGIQEMVAVYTPAQGSWRGYTGFTLSVRVSVRPPVGDMGFICMLIVDINRSLLIFSGVPVKMRAWP